MLWIIELCDRKTVVVLKFLDSRWLSPPQDFRKQPNIKLELDSSHVVISVRSDPASALFDISQKCDASEVDPGVYRAFVRLSSARLSSAGCWPTKETNRFVPLRGIRLPLFDHRAIKRLRINEPGTNISANAPEVDDTTLALYKRATVRLYCIVLSFPLLYFLFQDAVKCEIQDNDDIEWKLPTRAES